MKFILIILLMRDGHGGSLTTQPFDTLDQCKAVARHLEANYGGLLTSVRAECLPLEQAADTLPVPKP